MNHVWLSRSRLLHSHRLRASQPTSPIVGRRLLDRPVANGLQTGCIFSPLRLSGERPRLILAVGVASMVRATFDWLGKVYNTRGVFAHKTEVLDLASHLHGSLTRLAGLLASGDLLISVRGGMKQSASIRLTHLLGFKLPPSADQWTRAETSKV